MLTSQVTKLLPEYSLHEFKCIHTTSYYVFGISKLYSDPIVGTSTISFDFAALDCLSQIQRWVQCETRTGHANYDSSTNHCQSCGFSGYTEYKTLSDIKMSVEAAIHRQRWFWFIPSAYIVSTTIGIHGWENAITLQSIATILLEIISFSLLFPILLFFLKQYKIFKKKNEAI